MTDLRKAAEMALEALDYEAEEEPDSIWKEERDALRQALAQPVDAVNMSQERVDETAKDVHEPVAWISNSPTKGNGKKLHWTKSEAWKWSSNITPLYTAPPKREWVGLTDEEIVHVLGNVREVVTGNVFTAFARAIEAKLKEKNYGSSHT